MCVMERVGPSPSLMAILFSQQPLRHVLITLRLCATLWNCLCPRWKEKKNFFHLVLDFQNLLGDIQAQEISPQGLTNTHLLCETHVEMSVCIFLINRHWDTITRNDYEALLTFCSENRLQSSLGTIDSWTKIRK